MKLPIICCVIVMLLGATAAKGEVREALLGLQTDFTAKTLTIEVASTGCTDRNHFRLDFSDGILTAYRTMKDTCKAMPQKTSLTYKLDELGIDPHRPFMVGNPFIVNEFLANMVDVPGKEVTPETGR